jgi:ribosomal protein L29
MQLGDLRKKNQTELSKLLQDSKKELQDKYLMFKIGKEKNTSQFKKTNRDIAQILTIIKEKEVLS